MADPRVTKRGDEFLVFDSNGTLVLSTRDKDEAQIAFDQASSARPNPDVSTLFDKDIDRAKTVGRVGLGVGGGIAAGMLTRNLPLAARLGAVGATEGGISALGQQLTKGEIDPVETLTDVGLGTTAEFFAPGLSKVLPFRGRKAIPGAEGILSRLSSPGRLGGRVPGVTPGLLSRGQTVDIMENIAESSLAGGGRVLAVREAGEELADKAARNFADQFVLTARDQVGESVQSALEGSMDAFNAAAKVRFRQLDELVRGASVGGAPGRAVEVSTISLKRTARKIIDETGEGAIEGGRRGLAGKVLELPDTIPFERAQVWRSDLLDEGGLTEQFGRPGAQRATRLLRGASKRLFRDMDRSMEEAARGLSEDALAQWRQANKFFKAGSKTFNSRFIQRLARAEPDQVYQMAVRGKSPGLIRRAREAINDEAVWNQVQGSFVDDILTRSSTGTQEGTQRILGKNALNFLDKTFGADATTEILGRSGAKNFRQIMSDLAVSQAKTGSGLGKVAIQLKQPGALIEIAGLFTGGSVSPMAYGITVAPWAFAQLMTRRPFVRLLSIGMKDATAAGTARTMAQAVAEALKEPLMSQPELQELRQ